MVFCHTSAVAAPGTPTSRDDEVDEIVDARHLHSQLLEIVRSHHSQRADGETHIKNRGQDLGLNYFIVKD